MNKVMNISAWLRMFRMRRKSSSYEPRLVGFPFVFIIAGWIMLWFIWPGGKPVAFKSRGPGPSRVAFIGNFTAAYSSPVVNLTRSVPGEDERTKLVPWMAERPVKMLERNGALNEQSAAVETLRGELRDAANREMNVYTPVWQDPAVFNIANDEKMHLTVESSGSLSEYGFQVQDFVPALKKADKPWFVTVFVQIDEKGKVEHVFLESGCENKEVNSLVVKSMYRGSVAKPGKRIEGRVKVNFGQD